MATNTIITRYKAWLVGQICGGKYKYDRDYTYLMDILFELPFTWTIPMDENRAMDGIALRSLYDARNRRLKASVEEYMADKGASWLEVLVALSMRCYDTFLSGIRDKKIGTWTVMDDILSNMGLIKFKNGTNFDEISVKNVVKNDVKNVFPVKNTKNYEEIWWQMQEYLERFELFD